MIRTRSTLLSVRGGVADVEEAVLQKWAKGGGLETFPVGYFGVESLQSEVLDFFGLRDGVEGEGGVMGGVKSWRLGSEPGVELLFLGNGVDEVSMLSGSS